MRASVLAALSAHESLTEPDLEYQVRSSPQALTHGTFQFSLDLLIRDSLVARSEDRLILTPSTAELISKRQASAQLFFDQFLASIRHRATANIDSVEPDVIAQRVSDIAATFFQAICKRRGLAIAQNLSGGPEGHLQRRAVALLQELPSWFSQCHSRCEIRALTNVVFGVLSDPQKSERVYLGFLTQAYFGKHIAGVDEESIALRRELLSQTVFVLDSHFIIVLLARGCTAHDHAVELVKMLTDAKTVLIATDLILVETTEHIDWAIKQVTATGQGTSLQKAFDAARGVAGQTNSFLLGYSECRARGECDSFGQYILAAIDQQHTQQPTSALISAPQWPATGFCSMESMSYSNPARHSAPLRRNWMSKSNYGAKGTALTNTTAKSLLKRRSQRLCLESEVAKYVRLKLRTHRPSSLQTALFSTAWKDARSAYA